MGPRTLLSPHAQVSLKNFRNTAAPRVSGSGFREWRHTQGVVRQPPSDEATWNLSNWIW